MRSPSVLLRFAAAVLTCTGLVAVAAPAASAQDSATQEVIDLAVRGLGGEDAVRAAAGFHVEAAGRTAIFDEGRRPGDTVSLADRFTATLDYAFDPAGDKLRVDSVRTSLGVPRPVSEIVDGRLGAITGNDANFAPPATKAMTSDRWAAVTREQRLFNPLLYIRPLLDDPSDARAVGTTSLFGRRHRILEVTSDAVAVRLFVEAGSGRITQLRTLDHNFNRGDLATSVDFRGFRNVGQGVVFPVTVVLRQAGQVLHTEKRSVATAVDSVDASRFEFPAGVTPAFDAELADRGAKATEWLMTFVHLGFIKDGPADVIVPREVAPGSTLIQGLANQSMIIEQQDGIVVAEAALNSFRAEALIAFIEDRFPGKPIRYVTGSHHHSDHAGGMRPFVALGATAVVHENAAGFYRRIFAARSSTLLPDRLDGSTVQANVLKVPSRRPITLDDPLRPVQVIAEPTTHATTTILVFVPTEGVLFVNGDTYTPGGAPGPGAVSLQRTIEANGLDVQWIVGGHGGVISYADFLAALPA